MRFSAPQNIPGYDDLVELYAKGDTGWYRARGDSGSVLLRVGEGESARENFRREMDFQGSEIPETALECLIRPLYLLEQEDPVVLVCEDKDGRPVRSFLKSRKFDLNSFLMAAVELSRLLETLHQAGIAHGEPLAENLFFHAGDVRIALAGLGTATRAEPRTDLRNLGALFHEMIHGTPPGEIPEPLARLHPGFPAVVSKIVLKLLEAEAPYQSAAGLYPDLRSCAQQMEVFKTIEDFEPGRMDGPLHYA